jgi:recombinational DNA repair protein RecT
MQVQNGNGQRGQQGRPTVRAERGEPLIRQLFEERRTEIEGMFARDDNPKASYDRAVGLALSTYKVAQAGSNDAIQEASVVMAALYAFQRKLDPGTDVYFVPFKGKVTAITSPTGLINVACRSGLIGSIDARPVFKGEVTAGNFDHELGSTRWVKHKKGACARPMGAEANWRELAFAYAIVDIKGATQPVVEVLDKGDIEYYRSLSPSADSKHGLWGKFPAEAARKAALKQALGRVPKQSEVSEILAYEAAAESEADAAVSRIAEVADLTVLPPEEAPEAPRAQAPQARPTPQAQARPTSPAARPGPDPFAGDPTQVSNPHSCLSAHPISA